MAIVQTTLAAGSVASPFYLNIRISKHLCAKTASAPVFTPTFTLLSYRLVSPTAAGGQYKAIVNVQGIATYTPCGSCCAKSQAINENFVIPFFSATAPTAVSIAGGTPVNVLVTDGSCQSCSNTFVCDVPLTLTVTA